MSLLNDIYYLKNYVSLYLKDKEEIFEFKFQDGQNIFYNIAIKRPILKIANEFVDDGFFDLETAYGYGGFYTNNKDKNFISKALLEYKKKCLKENVIAEFIRFHSFNTFPIEHKEFLDLNICDRDVVYVDLSISKDERWNSYSSTTRNILRKCEKELIFQKCDNLNKFVELYQQTMDKNKASDFYYFSQKYYNELLNIDDIELYEIKKDNQVISSSFFMFGDQFGHYHLSANDYEMRKHNANYFILDQIFEIAKNKGKKYFILGGGTTSDKNDTLLKFKQKFSQNVKPFYISGKIYNQKIYDKYKLMWEKKSKQDIRYFLKYRLEIE